MFLTKNPINQDFQETCAFSGGQVSWLVLLKILKKNQENKETKNELLNRARRHTQSFTGLPKQKYTKTIA
jgi:hypothetical protein